MERLGAHGGGDGNGKAHTRGWEITWLAVLSASDYFETPYHELRVFSPLNLRVKASSVVGVELIAILWPGLTPFSFFFFSLFHCASAHG